MTDIEQAFNISTDEIKKIIADFHSQMVSGLSGKKSSLKMIPAYVDKPTGKEKGGFIALDLGGTNLRISQIELKGKGRVVKRGERKFILEKKYITNTKDELFDFIAGCIKRFSEEEKLDLDKQWGVGFTFSFPVKQTGIASGVLLRWTKGFSARGVKGKDIVNLLNQALLKKDLGNLKIAALVNDTVGTLAARAYKERNCDVGVILGTGTNACYQERLSNILKWIGPKSLRARMIVNIEWGGFNKLPATVYDRQLDQLSLNPGEQVLEKMVSGMYLGELVRLILKDFVKRKMLFKQNRPAIFNKAGSFKTEYMSRIEDDCSADLSGAGVLLKDLGASCSALSERKLIKRICQLVSNRGARISAAVLAAVIMKIDPNLSQKHTIAIDGSLYEKHPGFSRNIRAALRQVFAKKASRVRMVLTKDGSGIGAAIIAALAKPRKYDFTPRIKLVDSVSFSDKIYAREERLKDFKGKIKLPINLDELRKR
ncbi:MAG: hexokinase [Candidatus Omnitrophota bacterium]